MSFIWNIFRTQYTLNGKIVQSHQDVVREIQSKKHDMICPEHFLSTFFPSMAIAKCVAGFEGMDANTSYVSVRSDDTAHKIQLEKSEKGVVDFEPFRDGVTAIGYGVTAMGFGVAAMGFGVGFGVAAMGFGVAAMGIGIPTLVQAFARRWTGKVLSSVHCVSFVACFSSKPLPCRALRAVP